MSESLSAPFPVFEELVGLISQATSSIKQGIDDGNLGSSQQAELEDMTTELTSMLAGGKAMYDKYLNEGMDQAAGDEMIEVFQEHIERVGEVQARINQLVDPQEV